MGRKLITLEPQRVAVPRPFSEEAKGPGSDAKGSRSEPQRVAVPRIAPITNQREPKEEPNALVLLEGPTEIQRLCALLADRVHEHRGTRPKMTAAWERDMDLLVRRGPTDWAEPAEIKAGVVAKVIRGIFDRLATTSSSGFCWADQIRSPGSLRAKWDTLVVALRRAEEPAPAARRGNVARRDSETRTSSELYQQLLREGKA